MKFSTNNIIRLSRILPVIFISISPVFAFPKSASRLINDSPKEVIDQVWQIIYRDYLTSIGNYNSKEWFELRKKVLSNRYYEQVDAYEAIKGMLSTLEDPYTRFLDPKEFSEMRIDTTGRLSGIGIQISMDKDSKDLLVVSPIEGSPAFQAGIMANDIIFSIDGKSTEGMDMSEAVNLIRGKEGTSVTLGINRKKRFFNVTLVRARIEISSVVSRINNTKYEIKIGYLRLKQFNSNAPKDMKKAIIKLENENPSGYILDLRGNPGGLLESSILIARQWINQGIIVTTRNGDGVDEVRKANGRALTDKPVVVLVDQGSASASEILAGAIQDNKRGVLVGKKTFGKGLVQSVRPLVDGSGLTVTVAKYLTPKGTDINKYGIKPDFEAALKPYKGKQVTAFDLGTNRDSQYIFAETLLIRDMHKQFNKISFFGRLEKNTFSL